MKSDRQCPSCLSKSVISVKEARMIYPSLSRFGADALLEDADLMCTHCHVARMESGEWRRLESVSQVAYDKSRTGNKSKAEYKAKLTRGSLPESSDSGGTDSGRVESTGKSW